MEPVPNPLLTRRLDLRRPVPADVDGVFAITSDPRVWSHLPSGRHQTRDRTAAAVDQWMRGWDANGLDTWIVRLKGSEEIIGYGGCDLMDVPDPGAWNLGYRLSADHHGMGYATELARTAVDAALMMRPDVPITARVLTNNPASIAVAKKASLVEAWRGPDPVLDVDAELAVYVDRALPRPLMEAVIHTR